MSNKNENSSDVIVKLIIFLGAVAAIAVAAMFLIKKFKGRCACDGDEDFCFDDEDFCDDYDCCCDCNDCTDDCNSEETNED